MMIFALPSRVVCEVCKNTLMYCHVAVSTYQRNTDASPWQYVGTPSYAHFHIKKITILWDACYFLFYLEQERLWSSAIDMKNSFVIYVIFPIPFSLILHAKILSVFHYRVNNSRELIASTLTTDCWYLTRTNLHWEWHRTVTV